jgi:hypothetical protein
MVYSKEAACNILGFINSKQVVFDGELMLQHVVADPFEHHTCVHGRSSVGY